MTKRKGRRVSGPAPPSHVMVNLMDEEGERMIERFMALRWKRWPQVIVRGPLYFVLVDAARDEAQYLEARVHFADTVKEVPRADAE